MYCAHRPAAPLLVIVILAAGAVAAAEPGPNQAPAPAPAGNTAKPAAGQGQPQDRATTRTGPRKKGEKAVYQGPTQADVRVAYSERIDTVNAGTRQFLDPAVAEKLMVRLAKIEIVECTPVEDRQDLYACNLLVEAGIGDTTPEFKRMEVMMVKDKDAWRVH